MLTAGAVRRGHGLEDPRHWVQEITGVPESSSAGVVGMVGGHVAIAVLEAPAEVANAIKIGAGHAQKGIAGARTVLSGLRAKVLGRSFCFAAGTKVLMGDGSTKAIEDIREGDMVLSDDPKDEQAAEPRKVSQIHRTATYRLFHIEVHRADREGGEIAATASHPFWTQRGWVTAESLTKSDLLVDERGAPITIRSIAIESRDALTFNLSIEHTHTFFVVAGGTPLLVHNVDPWDVLFTQGNYGATFTDGPWGRSGRTVAEAIAEARALGRLSDGLKLNAVRLGDGRWATLNNRTLAVARGAYLRDVSPIDAGKSGHNKMQKLLRDAELSGPVEDAVMRCK